jgi:hypothetical protein
MATYSDDEDLVPVYFPSASALPDTLAPLHEEAFAQINRDLVAMEWEAEDLAALTQETLDALVKPSCCYVMYLLFRPSLASSRDPQQAMVAVKFWSDAYSAALAAVPIVTTLLEDDDPPATGGGYVVLG